MIIMNSKKGVLINAIIFAVIIVGFLVINFITSEPAAKYLSFENIGLQVPLTPLSGESSKTITLKDYRGQNILIHFWASWCEACTSDHKVMEQLVKSYRDHSSVKMIGIASSDKRDAIDQSGMLKGLTYPQYLEESGDLALAMGVKTLPQTLLIDSNGRVVLQISRPFDPKQLELMEEKLNQMNQNGLPPFAFETSGGQPVTDLSLDGKVWVADFMFTSCPDMCPRLTAKMRSIQQQFKDDDRVRFVSISVDPETDTRAELQAYEKKFNVDTKQWYFLRGSMDQVKTLLVKGFKLGTLDEPKYHSGKFILVDKTNRVHSYYDSDSSADLEKLKIEIKKLLN